MGGNGNGVTFNRMLPVMDTVRLSWFGNDRLGLLSRPVSLRASDSRPVGTQSL